MVLAGLSYEHGANVHSLNLARALLFFTCLGGYVLFTRTSLSLPAKAKAISLVIGVLLCAEMVVLLGAIVTIPVALAVLIFYTYPMIIAAIKWINGEEKFYWRSLLLMIIGFSGLVFVLINAPPSQLNTIGIGLSVIAAVVMATMLITSEHNLVKYDNQVVLFYALIMVLIIFSISALFFVELHWPEGQTGWLAFAGSTLFYVMATFTLFKAVSMAGPLRTAIIDNTAPVWAILFGFLLLSQTFTAKQMSGALVVIVAIMLLQLSSKDSKP